MDVRKRRPWAAGLLLPLMLGVSVQAQTESGPAGGTAPRESDGPASTKTKLEFGGKAGLEYAANVFHLSPAVLRRLSRRSAEDVASRRFDDMESGSDWILGIEGTLEAGFGDRKDRLRLGIEPRLEVYLLNPRRTHLQVDCGLVRALGRSQELSAGVRLLPSFFKRNDLASSQDGNGDGSTSRGERRYRAMTYAEAGVWGAFAWEFGEKPRNRGRVGLEATNRQVREPFAGERRNELEARLDLELRPKKERWTEIGWRLCWVRNAPHRASMILDEPDFDLDLNGDLDALDDNVFTRQEADESRIQHEFGLGFNWVAGRLRVELAFELRGRQHLTGERFDDDRHRWDAGAGTRLRFRVRLTKGMELDFGIAGFGQFTTFTNQPLDQTTAVDWLDGGTWMALDIAS